MKILPAIAAVLLCTAVGATERRSFHAIRIDAPPVIDGKLDDACWQLSKVADDFRRFTEGTPAHEPSQARALYDGSRLYFGFRCQEPRMDLVRRDVQRNPSAFNYAYGNTIEVFLDPGGSKKHYWQFMVNTNGATTTNLATHDIMHLGDLPWQAKTFLGDDFFSIEMAISFPILHLKPEAGKAWGVNFCRARQIGKQESAYMYSSWQPMRGSFLRPDLFGTLHIDADLSRFMYAVSVPADLPTGERCLLAVTNLTGKPARIRVKTHITPQQGEPRRDLATLNLARAETVKLDLGISRPEDIGAQMRVEIVDAVSEEQLFLGATQTVDETH